MSIQIDKQIIQNNVLNRHKFNKNEKKLNRSSIFLSVGLGKTYLSLKYAKELYELNKDIKILFSGEKNIYLNNAKNELSKFIDDKILNYSCVDSLKKEIKHWDLLIFDECHISSGIIVKFIKEILKINPDVEILSLTGTPKYKDNNFKELLKICPSIAEFNLNKAIDKKLVNDININIIYHDMNKSEKNKYGNLLYRYNNSYKSNSFSKELTFLKLFFKNLETKELEIIKLINTLMLENKKTIIYAGTIEQAEKLSKITNIKTYHSKNKKEINEKNYNDFSEGNINFLINVNGVKESVSINNLENAIIMSPDSSPESYNQIQGRLHRLDTNKIANMYILVTKNTIEEKWTNNATEMFKHKINNNNVIR